MKKALSLILATLLVFSTMSCLSVVSFGAEAFTEIENNDTAGTAQEILTNETYTGFLNAKADIDWYKFESDKDYFVIDFGVHDVTMGNLARGWTIKIYDGNMNGIKTYSNYISLTSAKLAMTGTIYVSVQAHDDYYTTLNNIDYDITANTTTDAHWESEYNDSAARANLINTNEAYIGSLYHNSDIDWYKFESDKDYFVFDFDLANLTNGELSRGWTVKFYDSNMNNFKTVTNYISFYTAKLAMTGTIYVSIQAYDDYYSTLNDVYYQITANTTEDSHFESEYNNSSAAANLMNTDEAYVGHLYTNSDVDWYKFQADKDYFSIDFGVYDVTEGNLARGWLVKIYDSNMNVIKTYSNYKSFVTANLPVTGTIYVSVEAYDDYYSTLNNVYYELTANTADDIYWESEYNNNSTTANRINQGSFYKGTLMSSGDVDYYKFKATSSAFKIKFNISLDETSVDKIGYGWKVSVYPADSAANVLSEYVVNSIGSFETRVLPYEKNKDYYIKVEAVDTYSTRPPVDAIYNIAAVDATDGNKWEAETGKTDLSSATTVKSGDKIYGNFYGGSDKDYYKINVPASGKIKVVFNREESESAGYGWRFYLVDAVGSVLETVDLGNSLNGTWTSKTIEKEGNYYIKLECVNSYYPPSSYIDYNLTFTYTMTAPKLSSVSNASNGVEIKWSKVEDCAGYEIYRKAGSGSWKKLTTIKGESTVKYTDKSAANGTKYSYKVRAYDGSTKSAYSSSKTITFLSAPKAKSVSTAKAGVTFIWAKVSGATGYEVYRATGSGSYKKIVTVKSGSTVKFVDKSAKKGTTYKYKVRAYKGDSTSAFSSVKTIKDKY